MQLFAKQIRDRARELGLSDAEVARRAGLNERRYGHYVTGTREPNLETLLRIAEVLNTTPNVLLGISDPERGEANTELSALKERLIAAANALSVEDLKLAVSQIEAMIAHRG